MTTITIDVNAMHADHRSSTKISGVVAHEGQHGFDQHWNREFSRNGNGELTWNGMPRNREEEFSHERKGARTEAYFFAGSHVNAPWGTWTKAHGMDPAKIDAEAKASTDSWCLSGHPGC